MEIVGHDATWQQLDRAHSEERLAHALLFTGPAGIGKALVATRFAARIACAQVVAPCDNCDSCLQVKAQSHPDVRFLRPAAGKKEIGVDLARDIKRFAQMRAVSSICKIIVIDQAERLSVAAQNALLKTLEEPPGKAVIMLIAESPGALLTTVRSRCRRVNFTPLNDKQMRRFLEDQGLDDEVLDAVLTLAGGSPGRALQVREMIQSGVIENLESSLAALKSTRYLPSVDFAKKLGQSEEEMTARLSLLEALLHQRLIRTITAEHATDGRADLDHTLRQIALLAKARELLRRRNPNRSLLAEATATRMARV